MDYEVRRIRAEDWRQLRALRLEALQDTPIGFAERYADALERTEQEWREQARRSAEADDTALFVALDYTKRAIGSTGIYTEPKAAEGQPVETQGNVMVVYAVYVTPRFRGARLGVAARLFDATFAWARESAHADAITLTVHEDNERAHSFYRRYGFEDTGATVPWVLDETASMVTMRYPRERTE